MPEFNPGAAADLNEAVKERYEANADTNAFSDAEKAKLGGVAPGATTNATDAALRDRASHTGSQPQSSVTGLESDLAARQAADPTLSGLSALPATPGVIEQTAPDSFATRAIGTASPTDLLARGDADARYAATNHGHATLPTATQKAALDNANAPNSGNPFLTTSDLEGGLPTGQIPGDFVNYDSDTQGIQTTTDSDWLDLADMDLTVVTASAVPVRAVFSYTVSRTGGTSSEAAFRIVRIDTGVPVETSLGMQSTIESPGSLGNGSVNFRSAALVAGTYVFRPQFRRVSGNGTIQFIRGQFQCQAQQAPIGPQGDTGLQGPLGPQGLQGPQGAPGTTDWSGLANVPAVLNSTTASFTTAQETKLAGIATGATANSTDATLLNRANHIGTQPWSTLTGAPTTLAGYGITDAQGLDGTLTSLAGLNATAGLVEQTGADAFTKRAIGVAASTSILSRADGDVRYATTAQANATHTGEVTGATALTITNGAVTNAKLASMAANTIKANATASSGSPSDIAIGLSQLFGRGAAGDLTPITLGTNLTMSGTTLNAAEGGGVTDGDKGDITVVGATWTIDAAAVTLGKLGGDAIAAFAAAVHGHAAATTSVAGFLSAADKTKLDGVATGATANATDAALRDRATQTGTQPASTISDFSAAADARIAAASVNALTDVTVTAPTTGQVLKYNGSAWVNDADATGAGGGGSPAGTGTELQYRDGSSFGAAGKVSVGASGNLILGSNAVQPTLPPADTLQFYGRRRAGSDWPEIQRPNGREIPLGPHMGLNRIAWWAPSTGTTVTANGIPRTAVGTVSTPAPTSTNLSTSIRRWRNTSAATLNSAATERAATQVCWRGNAPGLGGFTYTNRISLVTLQAASHGYFGLYGSTGAIAGTAVLSTFINAIGFGFTNGTHTNWQLCHNDASGAMTFVDCGANFPVASLTNVYTIVLYASPNGSSIWARIVNENNGAFFEQEVTTNIISSVDFFAIHNYLNNGGVAAAVAYDCSGVYLETDY